MAIPIVPLINGKSPEWADIQVIVMGVPIVGITSVEYEEKQSMENIYGAGEYPVSQGYGKVECTCKMTLKMEEVQSIMAVAPLGRLNKIPSFDIVVMYLDDSYTVVKHTVKNCRFMGNNRKSKQGDTSIDVEFDILCSHIQWL
jgi:hypothetical protein